MAIYTKLYDQKEKAQKVNENSVFAVQEQSFPWLYAGLVAAVLVLWLILLFLWVHKKKKKEKQHDEVISLKTSILLGGLLQVCCSSAGKSQSKQIPKVQVRLHFMI